jgi:NitT/TauT family transport system permease protein
MNRLMALPGVASLILILLLVLLWQGVFLWAGPDALAPPVETVVYLGAELRTPEFWGHVAATGSAFLMAIAISIVAGLALGLAVGLNQTATEVAEPLLLAANSIPKIALYPIVLLLFGIGLPAKTAFGAIHGVVPVAIFTMNACRAVPPVLLKSAAVMRLGRMDRIRSILLPAALPEILTGVRIGFSLTLIGVVLGEMFGAQSGLGYLLMTAIGLQNTQVIMSVTLLLIVFAATVSTALLAWERRLRHTR